PSTSCRTLLATLETGRFSDELCDLFRVPKRSLPEVIASDQDLGTIRLGDRDVRIGALLCDQPAALLGIGCLAEGDAKCTYGTGAFVQVNTGSTFATADDGLLRSIAWE